MPHSKRIKYHQSDFSSSKTIAGLMRLNDWGFSTSDLEHWIKDCFELGVTTFDHADIYGGYTCEEVFGRVLKQNPSLRQKMEIVTKCGIQLVTDNRPGTSVKHYDTSKEHILKSVERSLSNLGTDYIDLLLIHRPNPLMNFQEICEVFSELKKSGKVLHFGVSNFSPIQFQSFQKAIEQPLITNQIECSVIHTEPLSNGQFDQLQSDSIVPMVWSPLGGGNFFRDDDSGIHQVRNYMTQISAELGNIELDQIAIAWLHQYPVDLGVVLGTGKMNRIKNAVLAESMKLDKQQWFKILELSRGYQVA